MELDMISSRLREYLRVKKLTARDFERITGLGNGTTAHIGSSTRKTTFNRISKSGIDLNIDWLLTGEGEMTKPKGIVNEAEDVTSEEIEVLNAGLKNGTFRMVPLINVDSVGGVHSENSITASEQYVIQMMPFTEARDGDVAILQSGNSMYPTIPSGSALLIREVVDWREYFGYGNIYVLWLKDGRRITKEVRRYDADPKNYIWCVSYNPDVADEELPRSMIRGVWKVVKYIADFGW